MIETVYDSKDEHSTHFRPVVDSIRIYRVFKFAFGKFLLASVSSSIIDLILFQFFCIILRGDDGGPGYAAVATVAARIISAVYNYLINYFVVFNSKKRHGQSALRYFMLAVLQMGLSAVFTTWGLALVHAKVELFVKVPVDVILFFVSYNIQKRYIY